MTVLSLRCGTQRDVDGGNFLLKIVGGLEASIDGY